jgi:hypothetical protein
MDQLGLSEGAFTIRMFGTSMRVSEGNDAMALFTAGAALCPHSIGDAPVDPPLPSSLIAIEMDPGPFADAAGRLSAAQHLCIAALAIGSAVGAGRLYWSPAQLWSPFSALKDAVVALQDQGLPPILHLVAMVSRAEGRLSTNGLSLFSGVEIILEYPPHMPSADAVRRLARLAIHAMVVGPMQSGAAIAGLEPGEALLFGHTEPGDPPHAMVQLKQGWG